MVLCLQTLNGGKQVGDHVGVVSGEIVLAQGQEASERDQQAVGLVLFVRLNPGNLEVIGRSI